MTDEEVKKIFKPGNFYAMPRSGIMYSLYECLSIRYGVIYFDTIDLRREYIDGPFKIAYIHRNDVWPFHLVALKDMEPLDDLEQEIRLRIKEIFETPDYD